MRYFYGPVIVSVLALGALLVFGGWTAFFVAVMLTILEVTLSFDNAVVNAKVLAGMNETWRNRFLTWGMLVAVFGTRLVLPILIVAASVWLSPWAVAQMAAFAPDEYAHLLEGARYAINAFGGAFLLMVSLKYFFDETKEVHWLQTIEHHLSRWGKIEALEIGLALFALFGFSFLLPEEVRAAVLASGIMGIALFIFMQGIASTFSVEVKEAEAKGLALFIYLNILDSAFSLDSVVGAFALTTSIPIIVVGLGIGAYFVRALTIYLVERKTLDTLTYLEHGAHWAIFGLAASMFAGLLWHVPEIITGGIGLAFVVAAYYSSLKRAPRIAS